ncbi:hypothetical protein QCD79_33795, partial [Pseudomonas quasicaspiana]|nr:hypothetical protein [Pseudomonas quasicaspiana]
KQILLATGACQHGGPGWYRRRIVPVGSFVIVTEVLPQQLIDQSLRQHLGHNHKAAHRHDAPSIPAGTAMLAST